MADYRPQISQEEKLRRQKRRAARRRKRIARRLIPILLLLILIVVLAVLLRKAFRQDQPTESTAPAMNGSAVIAAVGDISMTEDMIRFFRRGEDYDFSGCFANVTAQIAGADLALGNLEGNIADTASDHVYPPALLDALAGCGFDVLQTANSYSIQSGITGLCRTKEEIEAAGMTALGTFASREQREETGGVLIRDINGIRFAFVALTKGLNNLRVPEGSEYCVNLLFSDYDTNYSAIDRSAILALLENAKAKSPDVIIAMIHWGSEYVLDLTNTQKNIAELLFSNGVDVILGSHSHLVGPMQKQTVSTLLGTKELGFAAYSLGDFLSSAEKQDARAGCVLRLEFTKLNGNTALTDISYSPTYTTVPSEELETTEYAVYDVLDAIHLFEQGYYDRISQKLYELLLDVPERLQKQTDSEFQRSSPE